MALLLQGRGYSLRRGYTSGMGVHPRAPSKGVQTLVQSQFIPLRAIADHSRRTYKIASSLARKAVARIASPRLLSRDEDRERRLSHCPARAAHSWPPLSRGRLGGRGCGGYTTPYLASRWGVLPCVPPCSVSYHRPAVSRRVYDKQEGYIKAHIDGKCLFRGWRRRLGWPAQARITLRRTERLGAS